MSSGTGILLTISPSLERLSILPERVADDAECYVLSLSISENLITV
jgi:hypothetical protein